jgi:hypothetical protein
MVCPLDLEGQPLNSHFDFARESSSIADSDSTTGDSCGIDSRCMTKAALYARVSTDGQQKEGTIESQLAELRKQVATASHELVKEYIDDGYSGTLLGVRHPPIWVSRRETKSFCAHVCEVYRCPIRASRALWG